jgi:hypothetical protein
MPFIDHPRRLVKLAGLASLFATVATTTQSWSQSSGDTTKACLDAYGNAQEFRKNNDLLKARQALWTCAGATCPAIVQNDCTAWLGQVADAIPSVVLEAKLDNDNVFDVSVSLDGTPVATQLDGKPVEINPGLHTFVFERPGAAPVEKKVIIAAHAKSQVILAEWTTPPPISRSGSTHAGGEASTPMVRPIPPLAYVLAGTSVAAFGAFAVLGITGDAIKGNLQSSSCASLHDCDTSTVSSLETRFVAADIAAGVGALAAVGAITVFLLRPERAAQVPSVGIAPTSGGAFVQWRSSF